MSAETAPEEFIHHYGRATALRMVGRLAGYDRATHWDPSNPADVQFAFDNALTTIHMDVVHLVEVAASLDVDPSDMPGLIGRWAALAARVQPEEARGKGTES